MKTTRNFELKGSKWMALAVLLTTSLASQASDSVSKAFFKDFTSTGSIGFYIIGGIIVGGLILHIIVNHIIKPKEDANDHQIANMPHHHHHHRHHHQHRIVKKTS